MRFTVSQADFMEALGRVAPAVPAKSTLPILSNVLLQLTENRLRLVATDLEVSVVTDLEVNGEQEGSVSIPAKKILDIVKELNGLSLTCYVDESNHLQIDTEDGQFQVPGISAQEFPSLPEFEETDSILLESAKLEAMINRTIFAVSKDELRPALTGVFFQIRSNEIRAVATDGHRLVRIIDQNFESGGEDREMILPTKALDMIRKNIPDEGNVEIMFGGNQIMVRLADAILYSRLIEGRYPHYESVIPSENHNKLVASVGDLQRAIKRAQIFANPINRQIVFDMKATSIEISAEDTELSAKGRATISAAYEGEEQRIGYNAGYVLEVLKHIATEDVQFDLGGPTHAGIVRPTIQNEGEDFLMLVMPVRLS